MAALSHVGKWNQKGLVLMRRMLSSGKAPLVMVTDSGGVRTLLLNNSKRRNVLSLEMLEALRDGVTSAPAETRLFLLTAGKEKVFSAGHDLVDLKNNPTEYQRRVFGTASAICLMMQQSPRPFVASVYGLAAAAGCQLVASCDVVVAADTAKFSTPGIKVGLFCSTPGVALTRAVPSKVAMEMLFTGRAISAQEALRSGLVSLMVPSDKLEEETEHVVQSIISNSAAVLALGKQYIYSQMGTTPSAAFEQGTDTMVCNLAHPDAQEGIAAFKEKRAPKWTTPKGK